MGEVRRWGVSVVAGRAEGGSARTASCRTACPPRASRGRSGHELAMWAEADAMAESMARTRSIATLQQGGRGGWRVSCKSRADPRGKALRRMFHPTCCALFLSRKRGPM